MKTLFRSLLRGVIRFLFRVQVRGQPEALEARPLLVIANHVSFLDGLLLGLFLPIEDPVFVVHTGVVNNPIFRLVLKLSEHLTVDPVSPMAMKKVIRLLEAGRPW